MKTFLTALPAWFLLAAIGWAGEPGKVERLYDERYRPQFHFTAQRNWINDPVGLVFYRGEYHLFFAYDLEGTKGNPTAWGHAVGTDLLHWTEREPAILPDRLGTIWSGSAVVDWNNTTGFQTGEEKPLVLMYTSAGGLSPESQGQPFTQSLAYSNDRGRTWTKYAGNPVLGNISRSNRDPKMVWHEPSRQWVIALFLDKPENMAEYGLFGSPNLKQWTPLSTVTLAGSMDCPDFFELPVDGDPGHRKWVFWGSKNRYLVGSFDGKTFTPETESLQIHWGANRYAAQTFSDIPATDGRRIQMAWLAEAKYPEMPFSQQLTFPVSLTLRSFPEGVRLCMAPVAEIEQLRETHHAWSGVLTPGQNPLADVRGELFEIRLQIEPKDAATIGLNVRGTPIEYRVAERELACLGKSAKVDLVGNRLGLQVLVDRSSLEIFAAEGRVNLDYGFLPSSEVPSVNLSVEGGSATVHSLDVWRLKSIWPQ